MASENTAQPAANVANPASKVLLDAKTYHTTNEHNPRLEKAALRFLKNSPDVNVTEVEARVLCNSIIAHTSDELPPGAARDQLKHEANTFVDQLEKKYLPLERDYAAKRGEYQADPSSWSKLAAMQDAHKDMVDAATAQYQQLDKVLGLLLPLAQAALPAQPPADESEASEEPETAVPPPKRVRINLGKGGRSKKGKKA